VPTGTHAIDEAAVSQPWVRCHVLWKHLEGQLAEVDCHLLDVRTTFIARFESCAQVCIHVT
jgi:hypothetical protein